MADDFRYDVFLSHSSKDKAVVRALAEQLRADGLRVWFDKWEIKPGDSIPAKIEEGLEHSRVLVLCMSAHAFGSEWTQLESGTFRFRAPLNQDRRFIPLRLDDAPIKGSLAQFRYIDWLPEDREHEYPTLLEACQLQVSPQTKLADANPVEFPEPIAKEIRRQLALEADEPIPFGRLTEVQGLYLWGSITDADLAYLKGLSGLQNLHLGSTQVTHAGLVHLERLSGLQGLDLVGTQVTDATLAHLKELSGLQDLNLSDTEVTDAGLEYLKGLSELQVLYLARTRVTDDGLAHLEGLSGLRHLSLSGTRITDTGLIHLKGLSKLEGLDLSDTQVTAAGIRMLKEALPDLKIYT